jgi:hypothetical protein
LHSRHQTVQIYLLHILHLHPPFEWNVNVLNEECGPARIYESFSKIKRKFKWKWSVVILVNIIKCIKWNLFPSSDIVQRVSFRQHSLITSKISELTKFSSFQLERKANKGMDITPFWPQDHFFCFLPKTKPIHAIHVCIVTWYYTMLCDEFY